MEQIKLDIDFEFIKPNNKTIDELLEEYEYFSLANHSKVWGDKILNKYIDPNKPVTIFELGTGIGSGTVWMSENLCLHADSIIHTAGIDPKDGIDNYAQQRLKKYNNVVYYNEYASSVIRRLGLMYDMIYIDGTHKYLSTLNDAKLSLKCLKENGIIVFDDYDKNFPGVVQAVDEFIAMNNLILEPISETQVIAKWI